MPGSWKSGRPNVCASFDQINRGKSGLDQVQKTVQCQDAEARRILQASCVRNCGRSVKGVGRPTLHRSFAGSVPWDEGLTALRRS